MKILSIDTSSNICGVAVLENDILLKEVFQKIEILLCFFIELL